MRQLTASLLLVAAVMIWGVNYVVVKIAVQDTPPFTFIAMRFIIATASFIPLLVWQARRKPGTGVEGGGGIWSKASVFPAAGIGLALFAAYILQTVGLVYTRASVTGFLTSLYVVIVPLASWVVFKSRLRVMQVLGIAICVLGLYVFSVDSSFSMGLGEWLIIGCAASYAIQIIAVSRYAREIPSVVLSFIQIMVVACGSAILAAVFELPSRRLSIPSTSTLLAVLFTGVVATTMAYILQSVAQKNTSATNTAVIFAGEPLFAAVTAYALIGEHLGWKMLAGGSLMIAGIVAVNLGGVAERQMPGD